MRPKDPCPETGRLLALQRGELAPDEAKAVSDHLAACPDCQARLGTVENNDQALTARHRFTPGTPAATPEPPAPGPRAKAPSTGDQDLPPAVAGEPPTVDDVGRRARQLGKYELAEELGHGGMGVVYRAYHTRLGRQVAVKVVRPELADHPRVLARFLREALVLGGLAHPNIVAATDADEAGGRHFLVMELIDGLDLDALVKRLGPLPVAAACEVIRQAAVGLQAVHEKKQVHRDLKPSNLMVSAQGVVKILDLGLTGLTAEDAPPGQLTGSRHVMGTIDYMAPEQCADSRAVDIRADVYSLGCTLYKLLVGVAPFGGPEYTPAARKELAHAEAERPSARAARPEVPPEVDAAVRRMMARAPADRFQTPSEVAEALAPFAGGADLAGLVAAARKAPLPSPAAGAITPAATPRAETGRDRAPTTGVAPAAPGARPWLLAAGAVVLVAGGAALALALTGGWRPDKQPPVVEVPKPQPGEDDPGPRPGAWYDALRREPTRLLWNDFMHDHTSQYDKGKRELLVVVPTESLVSFGKTGPPGYQVQMTIKQVRWLGGVGLFFGYRETTVAGRKCRKFQLLELRPRLVRSPKKGFLLRRSWGAVEDTRHGKALTVESEVATAYLDTPADGWPHILAIHVGGTRLTEVRWNERPFPELVGEAVEAKGKFTPADYDGHFGGFNRKSQAVYGNVQLLLYERRSP